MNEQEKIKQALTQIIGGLCFNEIDIPELAQKQIAYILSDNKIIVGINYGQRLIGLQVQEN